STQRSRSPGGSNAAKLSSRDMLCVPALKRPSRKECVLLTCAVLAIWGYPKRICSIWELLRRLIWFGLSPGSMAIHSLLPGFRLLKGSTTQRKEFASSVNFGVGSLSLPGHALLLHIEHWIRVLFPAERNE